MKITKEIAEMMAKTMEEFYAAYWQKHATPEQEAKRVKEGKTFRGAYNYAKSVAMKMRKAEGDGCVAMPDDLAYFILIEYMEHEEEGATYKSPEDIEAEERRRVEAAERKRREAEEKAKKLNEGSLIQVSAEDIQEAERRAAEAKAEEKAARAAAAERKAKADKMAKKIDEAQMSLFG